MISVNKYLVRPTMFPDKTSQMWKLPDEVMTGHRWAFIEWDFEHEGELMHIAQLRDLFAFSGINASLHMPYLPYARQDKAVKNDQTFAFKSFARVINSMNFDRISCLDPHSKACELIEHLQVHDPSEFVELAMHVTNPTIVAFPDKGAQERYADLIKLPTIYSEKVRDQSTGEIISLELHGDATDHKVLIVDDICDGGMTFIKLAEKLHASGAKEVSLYTTHGIYSKGIKPLKDAGIKFVMSRRGLAYDFQVRGLGTEVTYMSFDYAINHYNYMEKKENQCI